MSSRDRFEAWRRSQGYDIDDMLMPLDKSMSALQWTAWQARDAEVDAARKDIENLYRIVSEKDDEVERLVEALRRIYEVIEFDPEWEGPGVDELVALLREYTPKEKQG